MSKVKSLLRDDLEAVAKDILQKMVEIAERETKESVLAIEGMVMVPVKYADARFKNKNMQAGWSFLPEYAYVGARGDVIFGLSSPDQEAELIDGEKRFWETAEFTAKKLDDAFPALLPALIEAFGTQNFSNFGQLIEHLYARRTVQSAIVQEESERAMQDDPLFGLF